MNLTAIALTVYDLFGYLLPGCIMLMIVSVYEASFVGTSYCAVSVVASNPIPSAVVAYFLGHLLHEVARMPHGCLRRHATGKAKPEAAALAALAKTSLRAAFELDPDEDVPDLQAYILADAYILANVGIHERDVLGAREGFYRSSAVAFALLTLLAALALVTGGITIQPRPAEMITLSVSAVAALCALLAGMTLAFVSGSVLYRRVMVNNVFALYLALRLKDQNNKNSE